MPPAALRPQKEYGLRIGTHEGTKSIFLLDLQTDEALCVVIKGDIAPNKRSITTAEGEFSIEDIEIIELDGTCCLSTSDEKIIHTFDQVGGSQILEFLGMNSVDIEIGFVELLEKPCISCSCNRKTVPPSGNTKAVKLNLRPGVTYFKKSNKEPYFSFDDVIHFPVKNCILEKRDGTIFMMGESEASPYVLFTVGTVDEDGLNL